MKTHRIMPLPTIKLELDMGTFTYRMNYGKKMWAPVYTWYIEGAEKKILVDSGAGKKFAHEFRGFTSEEVMSFEGALASIGLKPEDIDIVIQTHLHWDHCNNTYKCKNARVVVQEEELKFALSPHPMMINLYHRPLFRDLKFLTINGRCEIFPGIELIPAPGHTPGIQAVSVHTDKGRAIISGFCSIKENFEPPEEIREMWPVITPGTHTNAMDAFDSALRIKGLADILIPQHDPSFIGVKSIP